MTKIYGKLFHNQTIIQWVKKAGEQALRERKTQTPMEIVEMDELYTYVTKKPYEHGFGLLLIGIQIGFVNFLWNLAIYKVYDKF